MGELKTVHSGKCLWVGFFQWHVQSFIGQEVSQQNGLQFHFSLVSFSIYHPCRQVFESRLSHYISSSFLMKFEVLLTLYCSDINQTSVRSFSSAPAPCQTRSLAVTSMTCIYEYIRWIFTFPDPLDHQLSWRRSSQGCKSQQMMENTQTFLICMLPEAPAPIICFSKTATWNRSGQHL